MAYRLEIEPDQMRGRPRARRGRRRPLSAVLLAGLLAALAGGFWLGYRSLGRGGPETVPIIRADDRPVKVAPNQPGGMAVPDQEIYILNREHTVDSHVEQLLPPPETPLPRPAPELPAVSTPAAPDTAAPPPPPAPPSAALPPPAPTPQPAAASNPPPQAAPPIAPAAAPTPAAISLPPKPTLPPAAPPQAAPTPAPAAISLPPKPALPTPAPPQAEPTAPAAGSWRIQVGAVRSSEAAQREWDRLKRTEPELLGQRHADAVRLDLGERGVFYRIVVGPVGDAGEAERLCGALKQHNLGCILVKP